MNNTQKHHNLINPADFDLIPCGRLKSIQESNRRAGGLLGLSSFTEFELRQVPSTFYKLVEFFRKLNERFDECRFVWITDNAFIRIRTFGPVDLELPGAYKRQRFTLKITRDAHDYHSWKSIMVHAATLEDAVTCLNVLFQIPDPHYQVLRVWRQMVSADSNIHCPFQPGVLRHLVAAQETRKTEFIYMEFTEEQCQALATAPYINVGFDDCSFRDGGKAFITALHAAKKEQRYRPPCLGISGAVPFDERNWEKLLTRYELKRLELSDVEFNLKGTRQIVEANTYALELWEWCQMRDNGNMLIQSIRTGAGPRSLCFPTRFLGDGDDDDQIFPFRNAQQCIKFARALGQDTCRLEKLKISLVNVSSAVIRELTTALADNRSLMKLHLYDGTWDMHSLWNLLRAFQNHPTIRSIRLEGDFTSVRDAPQTMAVVQDLLDQNPVLERIKLSPGMHRKTPQEWQKNIATRMERNVYRKRLDRFVQARAEQSAHWTAALLGNEISRLVLPQQDEPRRSVSSASCVYMLLCEHQDVLVTALSEQLGPPSKRARTD